MDLLHGSVEYWILIGLLADKYCCIIECCPRKLFCIYLLLFLNSWTLALFSTVKIGILIHTIFLVKYIFFA